MFSKNDQENDCLSTLEASDALEPLALQSQEWGAAKDKGKQRAEGGHCLGENKTAVMLVRKSDGDKVTMDKTHR